EAPGGAGHRAAREQQVVLGIDRDDLEALLGDALVAHLTGPADALVHARRRRRGADRTGGARVGRAVRLGPTGVFVALDRPLEALALGCPRDLHASAHLEGLDGDGLAQLELAGLVAKLGQ